MVKPAADADFLSLGKPNFVSDTEISLMLSNWKKITYIYTFFLVIVIFYHYEKYNSKANTRTVF